MQVSCATYAGLVKPELQQASDAWARIDHDSGPHERVDGKQPDWTNI